MTTTERYRNLMAAPSYHWAPAFAAEVRLAVTQFAPTAIAVEAPPEARADLEWAVDCWPTPVCAVVADLVFPFVPGDSILEALRLGRQAGIPVHLVDTLVRRPRRRPHPLPDPGLAAGQGPRFRGAVEAVAALRPRIRADAAREGAMARALAELMGSSERVLWVGGMAHWRPIARRLAAADFRQSKASRVEWRDAERLRLTPDAMVRLTGRYPWLAARYAADPEGYDEVAALHTLVLAALDESPDTEGLVLTEPGRPPEDAGAQEPAHPADAARVLAYARALAATARISDRPTLHELVVAGVAVVGRRYAGRLLTLALAQDPPSAPAAGLPELTVVDRPGTHRYLVDRQERRLVPGWGRSAAADRKVPGLSVLRQALASPFADLPEGDGDCERQFHCHPVEERQYERFVGLVLRRASRPQPGEAVSAPFEAGLGDGLDVRDTLRRRHEGRAYVRHERPTGPRVTNGIIDWHFAAEDDPRLHHQRRPSWIDPSLLHVGSASLDGPYNEIQAEPSVQLVRRDFSFVTLDVPTWIPADDSKSLYGRVILRLLELPPSQDQLYGWLDVFFDFCAGKPVAWFSRYVPGARAHAVARQHRVTILHLPLVRIPEPLRERNRCFHFALLTEAQWEVAARRASSAWSTWLG